MARLIMVVEHGRLHQGRDPHDVARNIILGHMPGVNIAQARWADDVETVEELVRDEEDE